MSRDYFRAEQGIHITGQDSDVGVKILFGSGAPSIDAEVSSIYHRTDDGTLWRKIAAGAGSGNWEKVPVAADITTIKFRGESVVAITSTVAPSSGGTIDLVASPLAGDEGTLLVGSDFTAGVSHILFGFGGTGKLMKVSVVAGDVITLVDVSPALSAGDSFVVQKYLPNVGGTYENQALVYFTGAAGVGNFIKLGDVNWAYADGISTTAGYTAASGNVVPGDSVQAALQKIDGVNDAQDTALGLSQGATNFGTFTGGLLTSAQSAKQLFQQLSNLIGGLFTLSKPAKETAITTVRTLDSLKCQSYSAAKWFVVATLDSNPVQKQAYEVYACHDGSLVADAVNTDETIYAKLKVGNPFNVVLTTDVSGTGAAQLMNIKASASAAISVSVTRLEVNY